MTAPKKFILLAEDDVIMAELALHALAAMTPPPAVVHVRDGLEAMDFLHARGAFQGREPGTPALLLLDVNMPRLDGFEVLRQVKSHDRLRSLPIVMLTSSQEESDVHASYQLGANGYVVKPGEFGQLAQVLQRLEAFWLGVNRPPPDAPKETPRGPSAAPDCDARRA